MLPVRFNVSGCRRRQSAVSPRLSSVSLAACAGGSTGFILAIASGRSRVMLKKNFSPQIAEVQENRRNTIVNEVQTGQCAVPRCWRCPVTPEVLGKLPYGTKVLGLRLLAKFAHPHVLDRLRWRNGLTLGFCVSMACSCQNRGRGRGVPTSAVPCVPNLFIFQKTSYGWEPLPPAQAVSPRPTRGLPKSHFLC